MNTTVIFWKPELQISAAPSGLTVSVRPRPSLLLKPAAPVVVPLRAA